MNCPGERDITPTLKGAWKWTCSQPATQTPCYSPLRSWHRRRLATARHPRTHHGRLRSEEHTSDLQSLMRISYAVFRLNKETHLNSTNHTQCIMLIPAKLN